VNTEPDDEITLIELARQSGFSDQWIEEELFDTVAAMGTMLLDRDDGSMGNPRMVKFYTVDEKSDIEIVVRRLPKRVYH
jgi:hypothetical protein